MDSHYDYRRFGILYVDDEELSLKNFQRAFRDTFVVFTASNAEEGFRLLEQNADTIAVVMSDQRMPGTKGVEFLEKVRQFRPRTLRILATAFSDLDAAIAAVNTGAIYKYITKPFDGESIEQTLKRCLEFFIVQRERDQLLSEKLSTIHKMVITDRVLGLGVLAAGLGQHVRNSMAAIRTFIDLAPEMLHRESLDLGSLQNPAFWQDFHAKVQDRMKALVDLLNHLSEDTRPTRFHFDTEINLRDLVAGVVSGLSGPIARRRLQIVNLIPADLPHLWVDLPKAQKLFELILRDELANLQEQATVRIEASTGPDSGSIRIRIEDDGPGLPEDSIRSLFDPFFVRNPGADEFGINLMGCYFLVHHHGGSISVEPGADGGMVFQIVLPVKPSAATPGIESEEFLVRVMTNERLWERLLATA
jgi:two-component system probable response regulator PhcQ